MSTQEIQRNKQLVEDFVQDLFTRGDLQAIDRYLDPGFVDHDPPVPDASDSLASLRQAAAMFRQALPDWHSEVDRLVGEDDIVVEVFTASGTHRAELMGVPGNGATLTLRGINVFRVDGDKIVERWGQLDMLGLLQQLGLAPKTSEQP